MYLEGWLRPPTEAELRARHLVLEGIWFEHRDLCGMSPGECSSFWHVVDGVAFTPWDLIKLCQDWCIPYEAQITDDGQALDWSFMTKCECGSWTQENDGHKCPTLGSRMLRALAGRKP